MICHNKLKEDNILINNNQIYLTNFEDIGTRHYIYDLASFINRYISKPEPDNTKPAAGDTEEQLNTTNTKHGDKLE